MAEGIGNAIRIMIILAFVAGMVVVGVIAGLVKFLKWVV